MKPLTPEQEKQIEQLYHQMYKSLEAHARRVLKEDALVGDVIDEAFLIACRRPEKCLSSPNPSGWLMKALNYVLMSTTRQLAAERNHQTEYSEDYSGIKASSEDQHSLEFTYGSLAGTEEFRLIKEMAVEGLSHQEMAETRGISIAACKKRVQRAKEYLKKKIK